MFGVGLRLRVQRVQYTVLDCGVVIAAMPMFGVGLRVRVQRCDCGCDCGYVNIRRGAAMVAIAGLLVLFAMSVRVGSGFHEIAAIWNLRL